MLALGAALTLVSNTLEPGVLGHQVLRLAPGAPNTTLGFATFAGLLVAIVAQPVVGALSDRTRSRRGRRLPYLAGGTVLLVACLYLIALAPVMAILLFALLASQLASNAVQAPAQALIPDHVDAAHRGRVAGLKAALDIAAFVAGRLAAGMLLAMTPRWGEGAVLAAVGVPAIALLAALAITAVGLGEAAAGDAELAGAPGPTADTRRAWPLAAVFRVDLRAHPAFGWWFANRLLFWTAFLLLNTFLLFFVIDVLGFPEPEAQRLLSQLSVLLGGLLAAAALAAGWLSDHLGRQPLLLVAGLLSAAGTAAILAGADTPSLVLGAGLVGLGAGTFLSANWALITDIVPRPEAARYLGVANIATAGGSALARVLGGLLIDPINRATGSRSAGYVAVYVIALACFLLAALTVPLMRRPGIVRG